MVKIAVFRREGGGPHVGAVDGDELVDLTDWVGPLGPCPLAAYLTRTAGSRPPASGERIRLAEVAWLPPPLGAATFLCVGRNYADHVTETGGSVSEYPSLFSRYWPTVVGHLEPIVRPRVSEQLDFEGELAVVIGKPCRAVPRERALDVVAGYTLAQEGTVRDWQLRAPTAAAGKNFARSGAMGPWLVTSDELPDPSALHVKTTVSGETMQEADTSLLIFDVQYMIEYVTTFMPLFPGDVILTGTPAGVGAARKPPRWLVPGDVVAVEVAGIGRLQNPVVDEADAPDPL
jgi:2-keto-4-pentenoate hydratase/2-oxohepta-3-ene-1,7-dioic acid hydratase in catechol pathway